MINSQKVIKDLALLRYKLMIEVASPRATFEECHKQGLLTAQETEKLLRIIRSHNETIHIYNEELADEISEKIVHYNDSLQTLAKKLSHVMRDAKYL